MHRHHSGDPDGWHLGGPRDTTQHKVTSSTAKAYWIPESILTCLPTGHSQTCWPCTLELPRTTASDASCAPNLRNAQICNLRRKNRGMRHTRKNGQSFKSSLSTTITLFHVKPARDLSSLSAAICSIHSSSNHSEDSLRVHR